ncbi:hypothetical protein K2P47_00540 [Patescibacteria group bacterium]|nr:hypothetical protein [Patescibacteria group bacterium]
MFKIICVSFLIGCGFFAVNINTTNAATSSASTTTELKDPATIEKRVREYFADAPVMIEIARCESKFRQFTDAGNVLRGGGSTGMVGIFQFYELIHKAPALALGFDIETVEGNIGYARHVFTQEGTRPWASCVPDVIPVAKVMTQADKELQIKLLTKVVELLTELLKMELAKR